MVAEKRDAVAREITRLSLEEMKSALVPAGKRGLGIARAALGLVARGPSARLGRILARFDAGIDEVGFSRAAREVLESLGARLEREGACPTSGSVLIVANHPGAYDALALIAALGRDDVALLAADRPFLRAMPHLGKHLVLVTDTAGTGGGLVRERARGLRRALAHLEAGGALVQFGAGAIEPDARFVRPGEPVLGDWGDGTGLLIRRAAERGASVVPTFISGVHSPRAKALAVVRWAERRGVTTIAPLIQATLPGFRDVAVAVRLGEPLAPDELQGTASARTAAVRAAISRLAPRSARPSSP